MGRQEEKEKDRTIDIKAVEYQLSRWRSLHYLITTPDFRDLFAICGTDEVQQVINTGDIDALRRWINTVKHDSLGTKTVTELRLLASKHNIKHYGGMTKRELLRAVATKLKADR